LSDSSVRLEDRNGGFGRIGQFSPAPIEEDLAQGILESIDMDS